MAHLKHNLKWCFLTQHKNYRQKFNHNPPVQPLTPQLLVQLLHVPLIYPLSWILGNLLTVQLLDLLLCPGTNFWHPGGCCLTSLQAGSAACHCARAQMPALCPCFDRPLPARCPVLSMTACQRVSGIFGVRECMSGRECDGFLG